MRMRPYFWLCWGREREREGGKMHIYAQHQWLQNWIGIIMAQCHVERHMVIAIVVVAVVGIVAVAIVCGTMDHRTTAWMSRLLLIFSCLCVRAWGRPCLHVATATVCPLTRVNSPWWWWVMMMMMKRAVAVMMSKKGNDFARRLTIRKISVCVCVWRPNTTKHQANTTK